MDGGGSVVALTNDARFLVTISAGDIKVGGLVGAGCGGVDE